MSSASTAVNDWTKFFKDAGIPSGLAANYAVMFSDHRITKGILGDLTREILNEMGIKAMGDTISILKQAKIVSEEVNRENTSKLLNTKGSESPKPGTPASRMITHNINGRNFSEAKVPEKTEATVFKRLGQESPTSSKTTVFGRLGDPVDPKPPKQQQQLQYRGVLKSGASPAPQPAEKRVSPLERLGPAAKSPKAKKPAAIVTSSDGAAPRANIRKTVVTAKKSKAATRTSVMMRLGKEKNSSPAKEAATLKRKPGVVSTKVLRKTALKARAVSVKKSGRANAIITVTRAALPNAKSRPGANVMDRLGAKVTSTTPPPGGKSPKTVKRRSVGDVAPNTAAKSPRLRVKATPAAQKKPKTTSKPISSNQVTSTTSAGLFRGGAAAAMGGSSVFKRLGRK